MTNEQIKELIDMGDKAAFLIGFAYGEITCLIDYIKFDPENKYLPYDDLVKLKDFMGTHIINMYYQDKK